MGVRVFLAVLNLIWKSLLICIVWFSFINFLWVFGVVSWLYILCFCWCFLLSIEYYPLAEKKKKCGLDRLSDYVMHSGLIIAHAVTYACIMAIYMVGHAYNWVDRIVQIDKRRASIFISRLNNINKWHAE